MYTNPPTWESAPEGLNLLVGSGEVAESWQRAEQVAEEDISQRYLLEGKRALSERHIKAQCHLCKIKYIMSYMLYLWEINLFVS